MRWLPPFLCAMLLAMTAAAQQQPVADKSPDTPSFKVGTVLVLEYMFHQEPETRDAAGNLVNLDAFSVNRAYLNLTGNLNRRIFFRVTPDIARETGTGSSLAGSYTFRLKYAWGQLNLDEWMTKGSWLRLGMQPTPYVENIEAIYRYRFQGPTFTDKEGFLVSSDLGVSGRYAFPSDYGDVHLGVYNGEGYTKSEANDQKAIQARVGVRPFPTHAFAKGLRAGVFYDADHYVAGAPRRRLAPYLMFEHPRVNAGFEYLQATDQPTATAPEVDASGYSIWATPRLSRGFELLLRRDSLNPNDDISAQKKTRDIAGLAYWIPNLQKVTSAILFDTERVRYDALDRPDETRYGVHFALTY